MHWEELTGDQFPEAVAAAQGVCLLPLSCIERHAHHLPLGTDMYIGRELCRRAAEIEPALIFPDFIFTQILEARHGLTKIIIVNAHGGNDHLIHFFAQTQLASPRDYVVYVAEPPLAPVEQAALKAQSQ